MSIAKFFAKHGKDMAKTAGYGALAAAAGVPAAYGVKQMIGDPEMEEIRKVMREVKKVKLEVKKGKEE